MCLNSLHAEIRIPSEPHPQKMHLHRNLIADLHLRVIANLFAQPLDTRVQLWNRLQIIIAIQMPKECARDPDQRPVGILDSAFLDDVERRRVDDDLVQTGFDEPTSEVLDLLACLDEEVPAGRDLNGDAFTRVAGPDVEPRVARTAVDRPERRGGLMSK